MQVYTKEQLVDAILDTADGAENLSATFESIFGGILTMMDDGTFVWREDEEQERYEQEVKREYELFKQGHGRIAQQPVTYSGKPVSYGAEYASVRRLGRIINESIKKCS